MSKKNRERWVEAQKAVNKQFQQVENHGRETQSKPDKTTEPATAKSRIIHIFDREGDIAEVFDQVRQMECTGVVVRAAHDRCLEPENIHLWEYLSTQPIQIYQVVELPPTAKRTARLAKLAVRFCPVQLRSPRRLNNQKSLEVYALYAQEIDLPDQTEEAVCWMLLTTEKVSDCAVAATILRWYTYRWHIEEYHKILKSGCKVEDYRLAATSMETLLGFLTVIAAELLRVTYLHRTQPNAPATAILSSIQLDVLKAKSVKLPKILTVAWAVAAVARLGGYLEHRKKTPIGIMVLWRGWLKLTSLCEGWQLAQQT